MKKFLLICIITFIGINYLYANPIDVDDAKKVAKNFMDKRRPSTENGIKSIIKEYGENEVSFFVVNFTGGGWIMVSGDNSVTPVLGFSFEGSYSNNDNKPEAFVTWTDNYKKQIKKARSLKSANQSIISEWDNLLNNTVNNKEVRFNSQSLKSYTPGSALLNVPGRGEVTWSQGKNNDGGCSPKYNKYMADCNSGDCDCTNYLAGCGAVAMGQIMWYWQWPTFFNWNIMPTELTNTTGSLEEEAVANLLAICGFTAQMTYTSLGSWTTVNNVETAFKAFHFESAEKRVRSDWPDDVWSQIIRDEIDCERPVFYRGDKSDVSGDKHLFVCDGYDAIDNNFFHFNFGWGYPGNWYNKFYFYLNALTPGDHDFNENQSAIIGISPTRRAIPESITNVGYSTVVSEVNEYACNSIILPANGKTITVQSGGDLTLSAGNIVTLNPGFSAESGSVFDAFIATTDCNNGCGIELTGLPNAIIKGDPTNGNYCIATKNANSYEMVVVNRWQNVVFQGAGLLVENGLTTNMWDGSGADIEGVYTAAITIRNNCGERIYKLQDITVLMGKTKSGSVETQKDDQFVFSGNLLKGDLTDSTIEPSHREFVIYPNPNTGNFTIETPFNKLPYNMKVYNGLGQIVFEKGSVSQEKYQVELPNSLKGVFLLELCTNAKKFTCKIVIN